MTVVRYEVWYPFGEVVHPRCATVWNTLEQACQDAADHPGARIVRETTIRTVTREEMAA